MKGEKASQGMAYEDTIILGSIVIVDVGLEFLPEKSRSGSLRFITKVYRFYY